MASEQPQRRLSFWVIAQLVADLAGNSQLGRMQKELWNPGK